MSIKNLFRGKRKEDGEWIYGTGITNFLNLMPKKLGCCWLWVDYDYPDGCGRAWVEVVPKTIGRCTEMEAMHKKIIFEGDIVKQHNACGHWNDHVISAVIFEHGKFKGMNYYHGAKNHFDFLSIPEFEIIGNIHDNPHLISEDKKE